jgi:hypothetical protein
MAEHRVPVLSGSWRRFGDPARSSDPRIRELVGQLRVLDAAPAPRAHFRAELRAQLVAVAPRLIAEGTPELIRHTPASLQAAPVERAIPTLAHVLLGKLRRIRIGRPLGIVVTVTTVLAMLLGGVVWISHGALPGDPLYAVKRASEDAQYSLTAGDTARGKELLSFARTRADEVSALLGQTSAMALRAGLQAAGGVDSHTAGLITSTLGSADQDLTQAAQMLGSQAVRSRSPSPLAVMTSWTPGQQARLQSIANRIPAGALHNRAVASAQLVRAVTAREQQLRGALGCSCLNHARNDVLGPIPCTVCDATAPQPTASVPAAPVKSAQPGRTDTHPNSSRPAPAGTAARTAPRTTAPASATPAPTPSGNPTSSSGGVLPLPSLPISSTLPVTTDGCGLGVTLGPIGIGLGTCGVHLQLDQN